MSTSQERLPAATAIMPAVKVRVATIQYKLHSIVTAAMRSKLLGWCFRNRRERERERERCISFTGEWFVRDHVLVGTRRGTFEVRLEFHDVQAWLFNRKVEDFDCVSFCRQAIKATKHVSRLLSFCMHHPNLGAINKSETPIVKAPKLGCSGKTLALPARM